MKKVLSKFCKIHRKTSIQKSFFLDKVADILGCRLRIVSGFIKDRLWCRYCSVNVAKFSSALFLKNI